MDQHTTSTVTKRTAYTRSRQPPHPLDHIPSFRAVISAASPVADLARELREDGRDLLATLTLACGDLVHGFALPQGSRARAEAHRRAWTAVRHIDRAVTAARIGRRAPARVLKRAQRAIDRADVMISTLPGVLSA